MNLPALLAPGVWRLGSYHIALYLIKGTEAAALFEVGISATAPLVLAQLDALGVAREEVRWVITSHAHSDHATGLAGLMAGLPQATHCLTDSSRKHLAKAGVGRDFAAEDLFTSQAMRDLGIPGLGRDGPCLPMTAEPYKLVEPGDTLDLGGLSLEFMDAAGHVPGGLTAMVPEQGALLASDSVGFVVRRPPGFPLFFVSFAQYLDKMAQIADMAPEVLAAGHQDWFSGPAVKDYLKATMDDLHRERQAMRAGAARGRTHEDLAQEMFNDYYHDELTIYDPQAMLDASLLLVKRCLEQ